MADDGGHGNARQHDPSACARVGDGITQVFGLLGKRWTGLIISVLIQGVTRFTDLRQAIPGISERMLADRLMELVAAGLVLRDVEEGPPVRVRYRVTEAGAALEPALTDLSLWAEKHLLRGKGDC
jgi:DNA-binding HxlR family transcriptional regulator